ncbi:hypothetical protein MACH07_29240 [Flagellimonas marinaquae]|uniref:Uncharacterized protein n=1 Tax=Flagellimonas marinaquae TaxID=254955 RepID=A0AA48HGL4_9FLAO|nr:hypothetical protein MACH07_29240 [Allomuricauda aquimarina]
MSIEKLIIYTAIGVIVIGTLGVVFNRIYLKRGIGFRTIQALAILVVFPFLIILNVMEILPISTTAVVAGSLFGYAFSLSKEKGENPKND